MSKVLTVNEVKKEYKTKGVVTKALNGVSFEVEQGEFVGIMGASGSGKSTLLNCISTIDRATGGEIFISGRNITQMKKDELALFRREQLGFIFQDFNLLDTLNCRDNIALALTISETDPANISGKIDNLAEELGISSILPKYPYEISGGQKQRVACARALVTHPSLILADEPTGALDSKSAAALLDSFSYMNKQKNATILMVTHDAFTASHCGRILFIQDGQIFHELKRGTDSRKEFFDKILNIISALGGDEKNE